MAILACASARIRAGEDLLTIAEGRCSASAFLSNGTPQLTVLRVDAHDDTFSPFVGSPAPWGYFRVVADQVLVHLPDEAFAAEAALRIAFQVVVMRAGGLLAHGSCVAFGGAAVAALSPSGAGKSTLAALCQERGAQVLTDEVVQLYPDGTCAGTPFRSSLVGAGLPLEKKLASLLILKKGAEERLDELRPHEAIPLLMQQVFQPVQGVDVSKAEQFRRMATLVDKVGVKQLTFRKDPAVGDFLGAFLERAG